jgi:hypothetical protein
MYGLSGRFPSGRRGAGTDRVNARVSVEGIGCHRSALKHAADVGVVDPTVEVDEAQRGSKFRRVAHGVSASTGGH